MLKVLKKTYRRQQNKRKRVKIFDRGNCFLSESEDKQRRKRLSFFILGIAVILLMVPSFFFLKHKIKTSMFPTTEQEVQFNQKTMTLSLIIYRHYIGYDEHCTKMGVPLNNYPAVFISSFQPEADFIKNYFQDKTESDLSKDFSRLKYKFSRVLDKSISSDFVKMQQIFISEFSLPQEKISAKDVCHLLEERATDILKKSIHPDFQRIKSLSQELLTEK